MHSFSRLHQVLNALGEVGIRIAAYENTQNWDISKVTITTVVKVISAEVYHTCKTTAMLVDMVVVDLFDFVKSVPTNQKSDEFINDLIFDVAACVPIFGPSFDAIKSTMDIKKEMKEDTIKAVNDIDDYIELRDKKINELLHKRKVEKLQYYFDKAAIARDKAKIDLPNIFSIITTPDKIESSPFKLTITLDKPAAEVHFYYDQTSTNKLQMNKVNNNKKVFEIGNLQPELIAKPIIVVSDGKVSAIREAPTPVGNPTILQVTPADETTTIPPNSPVTIKAVTSGCITDVKIKMMLSTDTTEYKLSTTDNNNWTGNLTINQIIDRNDEKRPAQGIMITPYCGIKEGAPAFRIFKFGDKPTDTPPNNPGETINIAQKEIFAGSDIGLTVKTKSQYAGERVHVIIKMNGQVEQTLSLTSGNYGHRFETPGTRTIVAIIKNKDGEPIGNPTEAIQVNVRPRAYGAVFPHDTKVILGDKVEFGAKFFAVGPSGKVYLMLDTYKAEMIYSGDNTWKVTLDINNAPKGIRNYYAYVEENSLSSEPTEPKQLSVIPAIIDSIGAKIDNTNVDSCNYYDKVDFYAMLKGKIKPDKVVLTLGNDEIPMDQVSSGLWAVTTPILKFQDYKYSVYAEKDGAKATYLGQNNQIDELLKVNPPKIKKILVTPNPSTIFEPVKIEVEFYAPYPIPLILYHGNEGSLELKIDGAKAQAEVIRSDSGLFAGTSLNFGGNYYKENINLSTLRMAEIGCYASENYLKCSHIDNDNLYKSRDLNVENVPLEVNCVGHPSTIIKSEKDMFEFDSSLRSAECSVKAVGHEYHILPWKGTVSILPKLSCATKIHSNDNTLLSCSLSTKDTVSDMTLECSGRENLPMMNKGNNLYEQELSMPPGDWQCSVGSGATRILRWKGIIKGKEKPEASCWQAEMPYGKVNLNCVIKGSTSNMPKDIDLSVQCGTGLMSAMIKNNTKNLYDSELKLSQAKTECSVTSQNTKVVQWKGTVTTRPTVVCTTKEIAGGKNKISCNLNFADETPNLLLLCQGGQRPLNISLPPDNQNLYETELNLSPGIWNCSVYSITGSVIPWNASITQKGLDSISDIKAFYTAFAEAYNSKNDSKLRSMISDDWESTGDGTTLADLEMNLRNSFRIFDQINYTIQNLQISPMGQNRYRASYDVIIKGQIYKNRIRHEEKSSVNEEVTIDGSGKAKITKTFSGRFWYVK